MEDPREQVIFSDDCLSEGSSDELADLQKEYEAKRNKILQKKFGKNSEKRTDYGSNVQDRPNTHNKPSLTEISEPMAFKLDKKTDLPLVGPVKDASKFCSGLQLSNNTPKIGERDLINRVFEFDEFCRKDEGAEIRNEILFGFSMSKIYLSKSDIEKAFLAKKALTVPKLYAKITPPKYEEVPYVNWCLIGIVVNKSEPKITKSGNKNTKSKFMKITIGNFKLSVDLFLFGDSFKENWKLKIGDVIAILNPDIVRWNPPYKGFHLKLNFGGRSILELGSVQNFGYCNAMKADNTKCGVTIDTSKAEFCDYHVEAKYKQTQSKRMELNGSVSLDAPKNSLGQRQSLYLDKNNNKKDMGGYVDYERANQSTTNYYYNAGPLSSNYQNPKSISNLSSKRRKLKDAVNNKLLEKKLMHNQNASQYVKLGLIKTPLTPHKSDPDAQYFTNSTLSKIGFDPRLQNASSEDKNGDHPKDAKRVSSILEELHSITAAKSTKRKLSASIKDLQSKKSKWRKTVDDLKTYELRFHAPESRGKLEEKGHLFSHPGMLTPKHASSAIDINDSESDIEIEFDDIALKDSYNELVRRPSA